MMWGQYCQETFGECISMSVCSIAMVVEIFRVIFVLMQFIWKSKRQVTVKQKIYGKPRICSFLVKSLVAVILTGISATQIFSINLACCLIWFSALILERRLKGFTTKSTKASVSINFCLNAAIAILAGRNSLDSSDNLAFYCYVGYLGLAGVFQIAITMFQKDYDNVTTDGLPSQQQSLLSQEDFLIKQIRFTQKTDIKERKIEDLLQEEQERQSKGIESYNKSNKQEQEEKEVLKHTNEQYNDEEDSQQQTAEIVGSNENNNNFTQKNNNNQKVQDSQISVNQEQTVPEYKTPENSKKSDIDDDGNWSLKVSDSPQICKNQMIESEHHESNNKPQQQNGEIVLQGKIQNIRIDRFIEMIKYSKKTIVFEIKFTWCGRLGSIKRSLREFGALNSSLKQIYQEMPAFPSKKAQNSVLTFADLEERKKQLSVYLQNVSNFCQPQELLGFLQSQEVFTGNNNNNNNNNSRRSSRKSEDSLPQVTFQALTHSKTVPEIIWEEDDELAVSEISR